MQIFIYISHLNMEFFDDSDQYIWELTSQEKVKQLADLIILGFDQLPTCVGQSYDMLIQKNLPSSAQLIYVDSERIKVSNMFQFASLIC